MPVTGFLLMKTAKEQEKEKSDLKIIYFNR